ncbi:MAG: histidine phosphatase family protein [Desulfobulbaceae bacterium]|nr:histidine phosphatase family protein [Desulfobulbaceae bacterium]
MPTIYLIRHGITAANIDKKFAGRSDEPLHPKGIKQLTELATRLGKKEISRIVTGPLPRTRQSGEVIDGIIKVTVESNEKFNEILLPHWDGLTKTEIRQQFGDQYPTWLADPAGFKVAGCETIQDVQKRAIQGMEQLFATATNKPILVVTHLIVARALVLHYRQQTIDDFRSITIDNGSLTTFQRNAAGTTEVTLAT